ncbi:MULTISPECIES: DUF4241 domain-containing protein [unclassified Streptomyces]|uniref:DUF4241 domain-containing protein n=1 Tax=unclassified Streptomyces TaxID=2593676 RepID=UPI002E2CBA39|nr:MULTISPECIES: DUF4241 domain-containing protein [unclassified Streptomyces]
MPITAPDFSWFFTPGSTFSYEEGPTGTLAVVDGGELWLPTGRVVACDPFIGLGGGYTAPFTAEAAPGRYRVQVAMATLTEPGEEPADKPHRRVAAARLLITDRPVVSWELAVRDGQDLAELDDDGFFGYGVDAGAGSFYDAACDDSFPDCEGDVGPLWDAFEAAGHVAGVHLVDGENGHNLAAFSSGFGDGHYPTWIGRDAAGAVTCFVTDFFVVPDGQAPAMS